MAVAHLVINPCEIVEAVVLLAVVVCMVQVACTLLYVCVSQSVHYARRLLLGCMGLSLILTEAGTILCHRVLQR